MAGRWYAMAAAANVTAKSSGTGTEGRREGWTVHAPFPFGEGIIFLILTRQCLPPGSPGTLVPKSHPARMQLWSGRDVSNRPEEGALPGPERMM